MKKTIFVILVVIAIALFFFNPLAEFDAETPAREIFTAEAELQLLPAVAGDNYTMEEAYQVQNWYVEYCQSKIQKRIHGFKAGLTSKAGQQKFNTNEPVAGVLFYDDHFMNDVEYNGQEHKKLMIEVELGFMASKPITQPITDTQELKKYFSDVMPVIELPELGFDTKKLTVQDIVSANVAARKYMYGNKTNLDEVDPDGVEVTLTRDGKTVVTGKGTDAMGSQWDALLWLVNKTVANGHTIERGHILITGALGKMIPGENGQYVADFGSLGTLKILIKKPRHL